MHNIFNHFQFYYLFYVYNYLYIISPTNSKIITTNVMAV